MTDIVYAGHSNGSVTVIDGVRETPLPHHVKHSPTGFGWGYGGSGPAELARCLLIHALQIAPCPHCGGTGRHLEYDRLCHGCDHGYNLSVSMYQEFKFQVVAKLPAGEPWRDTTISRSGNTITLSGSGREDRWATWSLPQAEVLDWYRRYTLTSVADA